MGRSRSQSWSQGHSVAIKFHNQCTTFDEDEYLIYLSDDWFAKRQDADSVQTEAKVAPLRYAIESDPFSS